MTERERPLCEFCKGTGVLGHVAVRQAGTIQEYAERLPDRPCDFCGGTGRAESLPENIGRLMAAGQPKARQPLTLDEASEIYAEDDPWWLND